MKDLQLKQKDLGGNDHVMSMVVLLFNYTLHVHFNLSAYVHETALYIIIRKALQAKHRVRLASLIQRLVHLSTICPHLVSSLA